MIQRRIPEQYRWTQDDCDMVRAAITAAMGAPVEVQIMGRLVTINATVTGAQAQAIKAAVVPQLVVIQDLTA